MYQRVERDENCRFLYDPRRLKLHLAGSPLSASLDRSKQIVYTDPELSETKEELQRNFYNDL